MLDALLFSNAFHLWSKSLDLHPPNKKKVLLWTAKAQAEFPTTQHYTGGPAAASGSGNCPKHSSTHLTQNRVPWPCYASCLWRDMWHVYRHLGEQELGDSRGTSCSAPEWPSVFSAENHCGQHYWPVRHYMEAHKRLSSPVTCCSINQDESCGMQSIKADINLEQVSISSLFMYTERQGFVVVITLF